MKIFKTTEEIQVPTKLIDQIVGQDKAVAIIKKAAAQKRNVLLIGPPGTGKSMLAQAMAELMPTTELEDILVYPNNTNENMPKIRIVKTYPVEELEKNREITQYYSPKEQMTVKKLTEQKKTEDIPKALMLGLGRRITSMKKETEEKGASPIFILSMLGLLLLAFIFYADVAESTKWFIVVVLLSIAGLYMFYRATAGLGRRLSPIDQVAPKLIVDNTEKTTAPFIDATGSKAGALLGDCKHDPLQSGGLGTPPHLRVESGAVHRANKGVLFIDEIASLKLNWQQELLTAMQEKKYPITGQSEMSSGALVKTEPIPTDFVLVAAGNLPDMQHIHPALRSRIRGAGYEIYVEDSMEDTEENEEKIIQFVAQEVRKDGKIPHFTYDAVKEIIEEARKLAGRRKRFTLNLRELGGLVRAAGDVAKEKKKQYVDVDDLEKASAIFTSIESQLGKKMIERKREYQTVKADGADVGRVNGLAVLGDSHAGLVLPIVADVTPAASSSEGKVIATGKLGTIAKEAVENVSAIIKKHIGTDITTKDIHVQFLQTYEGVEGDSASISTAVAVISAIAEIPVKQEVGMTGSLDVRGHVLPVGGVSGKIEAAIESGLKTVLIPASNMQDVYISKEKKDKINIIPVSNIAEVLTYAFEEGKKKKTIIEKIKKQFK